MGSTSLSGGGEGSGGEVMKFSLLSPLIVGGGRRKRNPQGPSFPPPLFILLYVYVQYSSVCRMQKFCTPKKSSLTVFFLQLQGGENARCLWNLDRLSVYPRGVSNYSRRSGKKSGVSIELSKKEGGGDRGGLAVRTEEREINDPGLPKSGGGS